MAVNSIQLGQVWRSDADGQDYLVTKVYTEVFTQYAMLRPAGITAGQWTAAGPAAGATPVARYSLLAAPPSGTGRSWERGRGREAFLCQLWADDLNASDLSSARDLRRDR